jgi:hypothetical protein
MSDVGNGDGDLSDLERKQREPEELARLRAEERERKRKEREERARLRAEERERKRKEREERAHAVAEESKRREEARAAKLAERQSREATREQARLEREADKARAVHAREQRALEQERLAAEREAVRERERQQRERQQRERARLRKLETCFNLTVRDEMPADLRTALLDLQSDVQDPNIEVSLTDAFARTLELMERFQRHMQERQKSVQREKLELGDLGTLKQQWLVEPRREADRSLAEFRSNVQAVAKEWSDRTNRQLAQIESDFTQNIEQHLVIEEQPVSGGLAYKAGEQWWNQFQSWAARAFGTWEQQVMNGCEQDLAKSAALLGRSAIAGGRVPAQPTGRSLAPLDHAALTGAPPAPLVLEVPSFAAAFLKSVRSNLMTMGMMVMIVGAPLLPYIVGEHAGGGGGGMATRYIMAAPLAVAVGVFAGRRERTRQLKKARETGLANVKDGLLKSALGDSKGRQTRLARWVAKRCDDHKAQAEQWFSDVVMPDLTQAEAQAEERLRQATLQHHDLDQLKGRIGSTLSELSKEIPKLRIELQRLGR